MTNPLKVANVLLIGGITLVGVSFLIALLFLNGTGFKAEYHKRQLQQCLDRHIAPAECQKSFGSK